MGENVSLQAKNILLII